MSFIPFRSSSSELKHLPSRPLDDVFSQFLSGLDTFKGDVFWVDVGIPKMGVIKFNVTVSDWVELIFI